MALHGTQTLGTVLAEPTFREMVVAPDIDTASRSEISIVGVNFSRVEVVIEEKFPGLVFPHPVEIPGRLPNHECIESEGKYAPRDLVEVILTNCPVVPKQLRFPRAWRLHQQCSQCW
jgi:hypothetical protein